MSTQRPPQPRNCEISVDIRQISRHQWAARITHGPFTVGEFGGPYAWSKERCERKAMRIVRKLEQQQAWSNDRQTIYTSDAQ